MSEKQLEPQAQDQPQPLSQTEAQHQALPEPQINPQPALQAPPLFQSEPQLWTTPLSQSEPHLKTPPLSQSEPQLWTTPLSQSEPHLLAPPLSQSEPHLKTPPLSQSEPHLKTPPLSQSEPHLKTPPLSQSEPHLKTPPLSQSEPHLKTPPLSQSEPHLKTPPLSQSEPQLQLEEEVKPWEWRCYLRLLCLLLCLLLGLGLVWGLVLCSLQYLPAWIKQTDTATLPCPSHACLEAAARLSGSVDPFAQPCDYFLFTCESGGASLSSRGRQRGQGLPQPPQRQRKRRERGRKQRETDRQTALLQSLRESLESEDQDQLRPGGSAVQKARGFYRSCMDTGRRERAGEQPFLRLVHQLGGWAVSGRRNRTDFNSTLSRLMREYATFPFFSLYVGKDPDDVARGEGGRRYIQIDQPDFQIPIQWNSEGQQSRAHAKTLLPFLELCQKYLALLGSDSLSSMRHVGLFISLSSELAVRAAPLSHRRQRGPFYRRMTIRELQTLAPAIDWLGCLQAAFHPHPVSQSDDVLLHNLPYLIQMSKVIDKWLKKPEQSDRDAVHTYMVLSLLRTVLPALDSRFTEIRKNFSLAVGQTEEDVSCWKQCVMETKKGFDMVLLNLLHKTTAHKEAEEMVLNIFSSLKSKLAGLKWRDEESRQLVLNEVLSVTPRLSTQREIPSDSELNQLFSTVTIREQDYFSNYLQLLSLQHISRNKLFQMEEDDILSVTPFISGEDVVLPMGMFVPPLFHPSYPRAVNYGVLGSLIAKDMLHLLLPDIHSQSETVQTVGECVWEQYLSATEAPGLQAFSPAQQQELWTQYSSLQMALQAYHQSLKQLPVDPSLLGLSHTHLFLVSFTQINCYSDPYHESLPFEHSFLVTVLCANSELCPTPLTCPNNPVQRVIQTC